MRMEELSNSQYIKSTDTVERYLLGLVEQYFKHSSIAATTSREYIIKKAVERMQEELSFESIGVLSITLPDGVMRTGAVSISLEELGGEPTISPKRSAFNVPFGTEKNTACEGDDPRLSDKRMPLYHTHEIVDIAGLEGILSTIQGKLDRLNSFNHEHSNMGVLNKLVYTGSNTTIDLALLETLDAKVMMLVEGIQQDIINYTNTVNTTISSIDSKIVEINKEIADAKDFITKQNDEYYELAKQYTNDKVDDAKDELQDIIDTLVTKDMLNSLVALANNINTLAGTMNIQVSSVINIASTDKKQTAKVDIDSAILTELTVREKQLKECQVEFILQYTDLTTGKRVSTALPYINCVDNIVDGSLQVSIMPSTKQLLITLDTIGGHVADELAGADIICNVYCPEKISI